MKKAALVIVTLISLFLISSCDIIKDIFNNENPTNNAKKINVPFYLTDKPLSSIQHLYITIDRIVCEVGNSDITFSINKTIDVIDLVQNEVMLFEIENVEEGTNISWLQIYLSPEATITIEDRTFNVSVQPATKIFINNPVIDGDNFVIDFDLPGSIKECGHSGMCTVFPVFHAWKRGNVSSLYSIQGKIKDPYGDYIDGAAVFLLPSDESSILRATISRNNGNFKFGGVKDGSYVIAAFSSFEIPQDDSNLLDLMEASDASTKVNINASDIEDLIIQLP